MMGKQLANVIGNIGASCHIVIIQRVDCLIRITMQKLVLPAIVQLRSKCFVIMSQFVEAAGRTLERHP